MATRLLLIAFSASLLPTAFAAEPESKTDADAKALQGEWHCKRSTSPAP
jgi:hypothetical protein